jgi:uncharacterized cofD-like protein
MPGRIAVLGGGHGAASVLRALRAEAYELTAVVTVADDGGSSGELRRRHGGPAVGDLRRALLALAGSEGTLARALARRHPTPGLGRHPLGNLVLSSLARRFGNLETASRWLGQQLGGGGSVLPATAEPVWLVADTGERIISGEAVIGNCEATIRRLHFRPAQPVVSPTVLEAITSADYVLIGPGSLFTSVLAVCALPEIVRALASTPAEVVWICNLATQPGEAHGLDAQGHLSALRRHGVRVDSVLQDPAAELHLTPDQLASARLPALGTPLRGACADVHDPALLCSALAELMSIRAQPLALAG